jgi:hypothetical protein
MFNYGRKTGKLTNFAFNDPQRQIDAHADRTLDTTGIIFDPEKMDTRVMAIEFHAD